MGSASLISALALSRDDTVTASLLRGHHRAEKIRKARRSPQLAHSWLREQYEEKDSRCQEYGSDKEVSRCMSDGCFTSQLLETLAYRC